MGDIFSELEDRSSKRYSASGTLAMGNPWVNNHGQTIVQRAESTIDAKSFIIASGRHIVGKFLPQRLARMMPHADAGRGDDPTPE